MNARVPMFTGPTANPHADAEAWSDSQEITDEFVQEAQRQAPLIVLAKLQTIAKGADWFNKTLPGIGNYEPHSALCDAIAEDDDVLDAFFELVTSPHAQELRRLVANWYAKKQSVDIYLDHLRSQL